MRKYFDKLYQMTDYKNDSKRFKESIKKNGRIIAKAMADAGVYRGLRLFKAEEGSSYPKVRLLEDLEEIFKKYDKVEDDSLPVVYEKDNLFLFMWLVENEYISDNFNIVYEELLYLLGYDYKPALYETVEDVILYLVLKTNSGYKELCDLFNDWNKCKTNYKPNLDILYPESEKDFTYNYLLSTVLRNGFFEDKQKTRISLSSINEKLNDVIKTNQITSNHIEKVISSETIQLILDTNRRRQWYFLRIIQKTIANQIDEFTELYKEQYEKKTKGILKTALAHMFLDVGDKKNKEIGQLINDILNYCYTIDECETIKDKLKNIPISITRIYHAFNMVFDKYVSEYDGYQDLYSKEDIARLRRIGVGDRDLDITEILAQDRETAFLKKSGLVPYIFAPKENRKQRHIIKIDYEGVNDELIDYYEAVYDEYSKQELFTEDGRYVNTYNKLLNGHNRKGMIQPLFLKEKIVSREMILLTIILSKVYDMEWSKGEVLGSVMYNCRCSMDFQDRNPFDVFCNSVFENVNSIGRFDSYVIENRRNYVSDLAWEMEAVYLKLDGSAESKKDIDDGVAIFNTILKGGKVY